jgi:hypothetical protein
MEDRNARLGGWGGIVSVVLLLVGFGLIASNPPGFGDSAQAWANYFNDHATRIQIGVTIVGVGTFFFLWFLGSLRSAIATAEGGTARLASIAFGGGLVSLALVMVTLLGTAAAAYRPDAVDPNLTRALNDFGALAAASAAASLTALFGATAIAGYRHRFVPAWVAGFSALAAVCQPLAFGVIFCTTGAFAADGALGLIVPVATFGIAIVTMSWALGRKPPTSASPAD